jgi:hypothetical protein
VRPPESLTEPAKYKLLAAYSMPASDASSTEADHLIPLSVGGSSDVANLWPEPDHDKGFYARSATTQNDKDLLEADARDAICRGQITLAAAQHAFATDWTTVATLLGMPRP